MKSRWRGPSSVRVRLTIWNVGILASGLLAFGVVSHYVLQRNLISALDRQMMERALPTIERLAQLPAADSARAEAWGRDRAGSDPDRRPSSPQTRDGDNRPNSNGATTIRRPRILTLQRRHYIRQTPETPWDEEAFLLSARGEAIRVTTVVDGEPARVLSMPLRHGGEVDGVYQSVRALSDYLDAIQASTATLLMLMPLALLLSGLVGAFLTTRALLPVRTLRKAADRIQAEDLSHRLPVVGGDEFAGLARTFNDMLERLERAFRQQARFTADASHELRTPLTVLRGNLSLALSRPRSGEEYRETLERVRQATERMGGLVEDLLLLARADAAQLLTDAGPVPLHEVLAAAVESVPGRRIELADPAEDASLMVRGNRRLLATLFGNLLSNADRHTPPEGRIAIGVRREGDAAVVAVDDTGEGIPPEHLPYILGRFYRADDSRSSEHGGAGLGLAICQSIATAHGGSIRIRSEVGRGTVVTVTLPLAG